jgi:DAACS family dicarboxylate/amino acid:cation (Na+ or H+) symporter
VAFVSETGEQTATDPETGHSGWLPLYVRLILGVIVGTTLGLVFGQNEIAFGWTNSHFGILAGLYIQLLTAMATPLIFLAIIEAFVRTHISGSQGVKMFFICAANVSVAFLIGLVILNVWQPGRSWQEEFSKDAAGMASAAAASKGLEIPQATEQAGKVSLSPLAIIRSYIPKSIAQAFVDNMILTVAALAILVGAAARSLKATADNELSSALLTFDQVIVASYQIVFKILAWLIELVPFVICLAIAAAVGTAGVEIFGLVAVFFVTVVSALAIHALGYYLLSAWLIGGRTPGAFLREGASAILTGFSLTSSLASAPLTLVALKRLGVSDSSARLSACVGTNFNNDGITLYEAMTALFIAQALGMDLTLGQQITILVAALAGSMGIAGLPHAALIILTLVLKAARLPDAAIQLALPIIYSIDFIVARLRSAVNVMGDMQVAILLDVGHKIERPDAAASSSISAP